MTSPLLSALRELVANLRAKAAERVEYGPSYPHDSFDAGARHGRVCAYNSAASAISAILRAHEASADRAYVDAIARCFADSPANTREEWALCDALRYACTRLDYDAAIILDAARAEAQATSGRGR